MEFRQLTPSALLSTLLLTNGQPEALLHNSADWAALFSAAGFNCQHGDEVAGYNASSYNVLTGRCAAIPVNFRPPRRASAGVDGAATDRLPRRLTADG
ncbi:hypothetical protein DMI60_25145 [Escherichia coli]|nr:hypothetical protein [Escherichia coli]